MKIQIGDIVKVKNSKTGQILEVVEMLSGAPLCRPEGKPEHALVAIAPDNLIIIERANANTN